MFSVRGVSFKRRASRLPWNDIKLCIQKHNSTSVGNRFFYILLCEAVRFPLMYADGRSDAYEFPFK